MPPVPSSDALNGALPSLQCTKNYACCSTGDDEEARHRLRVIKNRLAAKKSREQARHYVQQLEHNLSLLGTESALLAARLAQCERENAQLRAQASMARHAETSQVAACKPGVGSKRTFETMEEEG